MYYKNPLATSVLSFDFQINTERKITLLSKSVQIAALGGAFFFIVGLFVKVELAILCGLLQIPYLATWILLKKNRFEAAVHTISISFTIAFISAPWLLGPMHTPVLAYIAILLFAHFVFRSYTTRKLYFILTFSSVFLYILGNVHTPLPQLDYIEFIEFGLLSFSALFAINFLRIFIVDIQNYKHRLREREIFLNKVINTSPNVIFVTDEQLNIIFVNDTLVETEGKPRSAFIGEKITAVQSQFEGCKQEEAEYNEILAGQKIVGKVITGMKNGKQLWLETNKIPIKDEHKNIIGILSLTRDITHEKLHETTLKEKNKQLKKYIESNMQLENFAHMASHDLREPIRTIVSFSQLLQRKAKGKLDKDESEYLEFIIGASKNMTTLIGDLLAYALVDSKKPTFDDIRTDLLIEGLLLRMKTAIEEKQATVIYDDLPEKIYGSRTQITQLFQNLIANSIKFSQPDVPPVITIRAEDAGHHWQFSVSDNGIGIAPEYHERIFLLFRRLHTRDTYPGSGVGLATCRKVVDLHQGEIRLESQKGQGTTFYFTIQKRMGKKTKSVQTKITNETLQVS